MSSGRARPSRTCGRSHQNLAGGGAARSAGGGQRCHAQLGEEALARNLDWWDIPGAADQTMKASKGQQAGPALQCSQ